MHAGGRQRDALGEAAHADRARALRDAPRLARGALFAPIGGLAGDRAPEQVPAHAAAHLPHDTGVLVAQHHGGRPREESLGGVDVGAADAGGLDRHHDLSRTRNGIGSLVDGEPAFAAPRCNFHGAEPDRSADRGQPAGPHRLPPGRVIFLRGRAVDSIHSGPDRRSDVPHPSVARRYAHQIPPGSP